jgi:hypothetical protein
MFESDMLIARSDMFSVMRCSNRLRLFIYSSLEIENVWQHVFTSSSEYEQLNDFDSQFSWFDRVFSCCFILNQLLQSWQKQKYDRIRCYCTFNNRVYSSTFWERFMYENTVNWNEFRFRMRISVVWVLAKCNSRIAKSLIDRKFRSHTCWVHDDQRYSNWFHFERKFLSRCERRHQQCHHHDMRQKVWERVMIWRRSTWIIYQ